MGAYGVCIATDIQGILTFSTRATRRHIRNVHSRLWYHRHDDMIVSRNCTVDLFRTLTLAIVHLHSSTRIATLPLRYAAVRHEQMYAHTRYHAYPPLSDPRPVITNRSSPFHLVKTHLLYPTQIPTPQRYATGQYEQRFRTAIAKRPSRPSLSTFRVPHNLLITIYTPPPRLHTTRVTLYIDPHTLNLGVWRDSA